jgi:hypothetical protein
MPQGVETIVLTLPLGSEAVECASQQILKLLLALNPGTGKKSLKGTEVR